MVFNTAEVRKCFADFELKRLFISNLGWDSYPTRPLVLEADGRSFKLEPLMQKRGLVAWLCCPEQNGAIPSYLLRVKIDRQVSKSSHEHIVIYIDGAKTVQVWQWVRRQIGQPLASREQSYYKNSRGDALIQKLRVIYFGIEEEEGLSIVDVATRAKFAFDIERVTKRFYEIYKKEYSSFFKAIRGIDHQLEREWYASIMLNRLMFIYFIQKKEVLG